MGKKGLEMVAIPKKKHGEEAWLPFQQRLPKKKAGILGSEVGKSWLIHGFQLGSLLVSASEMSELPRIPKSGFLLNARSSRESGKGSKGRNSQRIPGGVAVKIGFYSRAHPRSVPTATLQSGKKTKKKTNGKTTKKKKKKIRKRKGIPKGREAGKEGIPG